VALAVGGFLLMLQKDSSSKERRTHGLAIVGGWIFVSLAQAFHSQSLSLFAPVLGLLTLPLFCAITYPWLLIETVWGTSTPIGDTLIQGSLRVFRHLVEWTLMLPNFWVLSKTTLALSWVASLAWILVSFYRPGKSRFFLIAPILFGMVVVRPFQTHPASVPAQASDVVQLDVGQGDSALVLPPTSQGIGLGSGFAGLIDVGSAHSLSDAQWLQTFSREGVMELNWVGLTHLDEDHAGGLERLARLIPIRCVASSSQEVWSERGQRLARRLLSRGVRLESWDAGCAPYPFYQPSGISTLAHHASGNSAMSAVLVPLQSGDFYLSAGDAEGSDEVTIFKWADQRASQYASQNESQNVLRPSQRVLKISHHGSNTSSDPLALKLFHPDFAVISVGLGNSYGHPAVEVMQRLSELKIPVHRTDLMGPFRAGDVLHRPQGHRP
jgi:competence protein ComEC